MSIQNGTQDKEGRLKQPTEYTDGLTKQAFQDECDINKIMQRAQRAGSLSHLQKYEGVYADFADFDFMENTLKLTRGREVFDELPSELRKEFNHSPAAFFAYVNDPANADKLREKLPALAQPGRQLIDVSGKSPGGDPSARVASEQPPTEVQPDLPPIPAPQAE